MIVIAYIANMSLATITKLIATMYARIATKKIAAMLHKPIKNSAAVMFHSTIAKHAANKSPSIITHAKLIMSQDTHVKNAALISQNIITSMFVSQHAHQIHAHQHTVNNANSVSCCQTSSSYCLSDSFFSFFTVILSIS